MTLPNAAAGLATIGLEFAFSSGDSGVPGTLDSIPNAIDRTQEAITAILKGQMQESTGWQAAHQAGYGELLSGVAFVPNIIFKTLDMLIDMTPLGPFVNLSEISDFISSGTSFLTGLIPGLDASKIISGEFPMAMITDLLDTLADVPLIGPFVEALTGVTGDLTDLEAWANLLPLLTGGLLSSGVIPGLDASKIVTGLFPQSMVTDLITDLADLLPFDLFNAKSKAGTNLVLGGDFEDDGVWDAIEDGTTVFRTTAQKHSGTKSMKVVQTAGGWNGIYSLLDTTTSRPGDVFEVDLWIYREAGYAAAKVPRTYFEFNDSNGVNSTTWLNPGPPLTWNTGWNRVFGKVTCPAGYDRMTAWIQLAGTPETDAFATGEYIYVDDVIIREVTVAQNIITQLFGGSNILSTVLASVVPGLDASKIITGLFPQTQVANLSTMLGGFGTGSSLLAQILGVVPNLAGGTSGLTGLGDVFTDLFGLLGTPTNVGSSGTLTLPGITSIPVLGGLLSGGNILTSIIPGLDTSKIITGVFSQSQISNLVSDLGARLLKTVFQGSTRAGSNLMLSPTFDDTSITRINYGTPGTNGYSTTQKYSGTHSWMWTAPGDWAGLYLAPNETNAYVSVTGGEKFYLEGRFFAPTANNHASGGNIFLGVTFHDSTGVNSDQFSSFVQPLSTFTKNAWQLFTHHTSAVPAGYDQAYFNVQNENVVPSGNVYHLDNVVIREETASQNIIGGVFGGHDVLSSILATVIPGIDTSKIITGTFADSLIPGIGTILDNTVNKLFGQTGTGFSQADAASALQNTASQIASNAASIQALTTTATGQQNSGRSVTVNFADYANGSLPAAFTVNYAGAGTSTEGIIDGRVQWTAGNSSDRTANNIYNLLETLTDYQIAGTSWAYGPENYTGSAQARGRIILRSNSAGTSYVYLDIFTYFFDWYFELGCVVAGVKTVMKSSTQFASGYGGVSQVYLAAGTAGGTRVFQVYSGTNVVYTHTEVGTTSQLGSGFRWTGFGGDYKGANPSRPPTVNGFVFADNLPPTYPGSGARINRTSTTQVAVSSGVNLLPTNFFGNTALATSDCTVDLVNGSIAVANAGFYNIKFVAKNGSSAGFPDRIAPVLHINGSATLYDRDISRGVSSIGGSLVPRWISGEWLAVPLSAGQYVQVGYDASAGASNVFQGEATGYQTYLSITLANKSLA